MFGLQHSFAQAARLLRESVGWTVADETLRRLCHAEAATLSESRCQRLDTAERFAQAAGDWEVQIDAGKVNTDSGWRDAKIVVVDRRPRGEPASSADFEQRELPGPSVRSVIAAIESSESFGHRCRAEVNRLGRPENSLLSVIADGAEWIHTLAARHFSGAEQVLDIFHATEHLGEMSRAGFGPDSPAGQSWLNRARTALVSDGWAGVCECVEKEMATVPDQGAMRAAYPAVANYLIGHRDRLNYAARLRRGQAIGSGLVEATIKQRVNLRMKKSGARWKTGNVGRFIELCAIADGPEWDHYWSSAA